MSKERGERRPRAEDQALSAIGSPRDLDHAHHRLPAGMHMDVLDR
jgi:hypothetical protein